MTELTPRERMSAAYPTSGIDEKRKQKLAACFRPNHQMERLIEISAEDPDVLETFSTDTRVSFGYYKQQRAAAGYTGEGDDVA